MLPHCYGDWSFFVFVIDYSEYMARVYDIWVLVRRRLGYGLGVEKKTAVLGNGRFSL